MAQEKCENAYILYVCTMSFFGAQVHLAMCFLPTTDQGTRPIMVLCGLAVEAKAYCDPHTGVARMPTTDIAKRWHCGVQMRDSGATALPEARETCTRNTRHRRFLNLNHNGNGTYHVSVSISVSKCRPNALREKTSARAKPSLMRFGSIHLRMPCD